MAVGFDPNKQRKTLKSRNLDFNDFHKLFDGPHGTKIDEREDYGEDRYVVTGFIGDKVVVAVYTIRGDTDWVISMREASKHEEREFYEEILRY